MFPFELNNILYAIFLFILGFFLVFCFEFFQVKRTNIVVTNVLTVFALGMIARLILLYINIEVGLVEEKFAGSFALELFNVFYQKEANSAPFETADILNFFPQTLMNLPAFIFFGANQLNLNITNCFLGTFSGVLAFFLTRKILPLKTSYFLLAVFSLYPAGINFSIFGLRDILIFFFQIIYVALFCRLILLKKVSLLSKYLNLILFLISAYVTLIMRPELLLVMIALPVSYYVQFKFRAIDRIRDKKIRLLSYFIIILLCVAIIAPIALFVYSKLISQIGVEGLKSPIEIIQEQGQQRYDRQFSSWGGGQGESASAFLPPNIYNKIGVIPKVIVQILGILFLPYPWLLTNPVRFLPLFDTFVVLFCSHVVWQFAKIKYSFNLKLRMLVYSLCACFILGLLSYGMIVNNAGNAFRMRLSIVPFLFFAASFSRYEALLFYRFK